MIGQIRGTLIGRQAPEILVDVGGIGYEIQVPMTTVYQLPELGQPVTLLTHFVVREGRAAAVRLCGLGLIGACSAH